MDSSRVKDYCIYVDEEDNACELESPTFNGYCKEHIALKYKENELLEQETKYCVKIMAKLLHDNTIAIGKEAKKLKVEEIYEFLIKHKWFIYRHEYLRDTVYQKLQEFQKEPNFEIIDYYLQELFPLKHPKEIEEEKDDCSKNIEDEDEDMDEFSISL